MTMTAADIRAAEFDVQAAERAVLARTTARTRLGRARAVLRDGAYQAARATLDEVWRAAQGSDRED